MPKITTGLKMREVPDKRLLFTRPLLLTSLLGTGGALVALLTWSIPNLGEFTRYAAQLPQLWQLAGNRFEMVRLAILVFSPVILALLIGACCWLWYTIKPSFRTVNREQAHISQQGKYQLVPSSSQKLVDSLSPVTSSSPVQPIRTINNEAPGLIHVRKQGEVSGKQGLIPDRETGMPVPIGAESPHDPNTGKALAGQVPVYITLRLLGKASMTVQTPDGAVCQEVELAGHTYRVRLLTYIAWKRGEKISREKILKDVFEHGKSVVNIPYKQLTGAFENHCRLMRQDLRRLIVKLNSQIQKVVIPPELDIFAHKEGYWWLADTCRVVDIEEIERYYSVIEQAESSGQLVKRIPDHVHNACQSILYVYPGDFLECLLKEHPEYLAPWPQSWAREPFTRYRDYLLNALWYAAGYELQAGQALDNQVGKDTALQRVQYFSRAANHYRRYAMHACSSRFDLKVTFSRVGSEHGERVVISERAFRRCLLIYGAVGNTPMVERVYNEYCMLMRRISSRVWKPSQETLSDLEAVRSGSCSYRLNSLPASKPPFPCKPETAL